MITEIKQHYQDINDKGSFIHKVAKRFKRKPSAVETQWISRGYIPEEFQKKLLTMVKSEVRNQKQTA